MALTTIAGIQAALLPPVNFCKTQLNDTAGGYYSTWFGSGDPGSGVADTTTAGGVVRSNSSGIVPGSPYWQDPASGNTYLAQATIAPTALLMTTTTYLLCDRLWDCGANSGGSIISVTSTSAQTINSATWPSRDALGGTNGVGVLIGLECSSSTGAATGFAGTTISYTNSAGTAGQTGTLSVPAASGVKSTFFTFGLAGGDLGVQSIQSLTLGGSLTSGTIVLAAYRVICPIITMASNQNMLADPFTLGFPQLFNGTVPFILGQQTASAGPTIAGSLTFAQG